MRIRIIIAIVSLAVSAIYAQGIGISESGSISDPSAILDIQSFRD